MSHISLLPCCRVEKWKAKPVRKAQKEKAEVIEVESSEEEV